MSRTKPVAPPPPAMAEIEQRAKVYADLRLRLDRCVAAIREGMRKVQDKHIDDLRAVHAEIGAAHDALQELVKAHPELFQRPKSVAFHGVTVGYRKEKGRLEVEDEARVIQRIERHMPEQLDRLAPAGGRKLSKTALAELPAADLKRLGVTVTADDDVPFVKGPQDALDKAVEQMLSAYAKEAA